MKLIDIHGLAIIPAKTDSTRLKRKNLRVINGKTLVEHAIDYAIESKIIGNIVVTSESTEVSEIVNKYPKEKVVFFNRDSEYMGEREVADVYVNVVQKDLFTYKYDNILEYITHVVGIQPDHPDRTNNLDDLLEYFIANKYDDLVTVNKDGTRNGAVRITKVEHVYSGKMSRRVGTYLDNCTNIHSETDLKKAEWNIKIKNVQGYDTNE